MLETKCRVKGRRGIGTIKAICNDTPYAAVLNLSYLVDFRDGHPEWIPAVDVEQLGNKTH